MLTRERAARAAVGPGVPRRALLLGASSCLLTGSALAWATGAGPLHTKTPEGRARMDPDAISQAAPGGPLMALTFDDGPDPRYTGDILDALGAQEVRATFFVIGRNAEKYPKLVSRIVAEGHELANHTQDHIWLDTQPRAVVQQQISQAQATIDGYASAAYLRPPRGWTSRAVAEQAAASRLRSIFWSDSFDRYLGLPVQTAVATVAGNARPGSIILCHDGGHLDGPNPQQFDRTRTVAAVPGLIAAVRAQGLRPVTLSELLRG